MSVTKGEGVFWPSAFFSLVGKVADDKGWYEASEVCISVLRKRFVQVGEKVVKDLESEGKLLGDATQRARLLLERLADTFPGGWRFELGEVTAEKVSVYQTVGCPMFKAAAEAGVSSKVPLYWMCEALLTKMVQVADSNLIVSVERGQCRGDASCQIVATAPLRFPSITEEEVVKP